MKLESEKIPSWAIGVAVVAGTAIVVFVGYKIYSGIKAIGANKNQNAVSSDAASEQATLISQGQSLTSDGSNYAALANSIQSELDGCTLSSTKESVLKNILTTIKNKVDWLELVKQFGTRSITDCGSFGGLLDAKNNYDLISLLKEKLDEGVIGISEKIGQNSYSGIFNLKDTLATELKLIGVDF